MVTFAGGERIDNDLLGQPVVGEKINKPLPPAAPPGVPGAVNPSADVSKGIVELQRQLVDHPDDPQLHNELGVQLMALGRLEEAIKSFQQSLRLNPEKFDAHGNLHVPSDCRAAYEFLGAWAIAANGSVGSREIHVVYATPGAVAAYRSNGHFAD